MSKPHAEIRAWIRDHGPVKRFAVVDDMDLGFEGMPFVQTDSEVGLTSGDALRLRSLLLGSLAERLRAARARRDAGE